MEKTLNMGAFEALDQQEMMEVDGGCLTTGAVIALVLFGIGVALGFTWALCD